MPVACHRKRWWNFCVSEDEKKEIELFLLKYFAAQRFDIVQESV